jgi:hypothetical protein
MHPQSNLNDPKLTTLLFAILVKRLGGKVEIAQADIDDVAFNRLLEEGREDGILEFRLLERGAAS